jgi:sugar/nucleoside kinase (ribokinase family)
MNDDSPRRPGNVVVVGSANVDLTVSVATLPRAGETVLAHTLLRGSGGKGANQAAAAGWLDIPRLDWSRAGFLRL